MFQRRVTTTVPDWRPASDDPAELVARVADVKRDVLLRVHRRLLNVEDLEDCFSQATMEMVTRARTRARAFDSEAHVANALEQRFLSRVSDRRRALSGRSPIEAATQAALRDPVELAFEDQSGTSSLADRAPDAPERLAAREDLRRLRELAEELTDDQRLVLACQVALDMDCGEFCARFGWSAEKFRKVAQRARARLRALVADYEQGGRCRRLADDLAAYVGHIADATQSERVSRHLTNCPACTRSARELERIARGVGAILPVPATVDAETVHRVGALGRIVGRVLPFWDAGEAAGAAKAGAAGAAAAAGGGGAVGAGGSALGLAAAKLGVVTLCAAGAAGGYVVCDEVGLLRGPSPRERHHVAATASAGHRPAKDRSSRTAGRRTAPSAARIVRPVSTTTPAAQRHSRPPSPRRSAQASGEFGFEGAGEATGSASPRAARAPLVARAATAETGPTAAKSSVPAPSPAARKRAASEFGFE